jgi:hypothetical protein
MIAPSSVGLGGTDLGWMEASAVEVNHLFERLIALTAEAIAALGESDADRMLRSVDERQRIIERVDPLLGALLFARDSSSVAGSVNVELDRMIAEVLERAVGLQKIDERLAEVLRSDRIALVREIRQSEQAERAQHGYRSADNPQSMLNLKR